MSAAHDLPDLIANRYTELGQLGRGGMSRVLRVYDRLRDEEVALKILNSDLGAARLAQEFRFISLLHHPGVVSIYDYGLTRDRRPYFTMELVRGELFFPYAHRVALTTAIRALVGVCEVLDFVHSRGVVHRDIKPSNIIVARDPQGGLVPKLLDFGIAGHLEHPEEFAGGTAYYMAPESIRRDRAPDHRTDLYAIGVLIFRLLTRKLPFDGPDVATILTRHLEVPAPDPRDFDAEVPAALAEIALRLLDKEPGERFGTARELAKALEAWLIKRSGVGTTLGAWATTTFSRRVAGGSRFAGRDGELQLLVDRAERLGELGGGCYLVTGEQGIGKTRLVDELRVRVQLGGIDCLTIDCTGSRLPGEPLAKIAGVLGPTGEAVQAALRRAHDLGVSIAEPWATPAAPIDERLLAIADQLAAACRERAEDSPFVLVLDGVEDVPGQGAAAVAHLATRLAESSVLVVCCGQVGEGQGNAVMDRLAEAEVSRELPLRRLSRAATAQLVRSLLGKVSGRIPDHVHDECGGNPGAAEAVVRALVATRAITERRGGWGVATQLGGKLPTLALEAGLRELAEALLTHVRGRERRTARAAALLGNGFDLELLGAVLGDDQAERHIDLLMQAGLLRRTEEGSKGKALRFTQHALIEVLRREIDEESHLRWSAAAANALEQRRAQGAQIDLEAYARHLVGCARLADAASVAQTSADELQRAGAATDAARMLSEALVNLREAGAPPAAQARVSSKLGDLLRRLGRTEEALRCYEAVSVHLTGDDRSERKARAASQRRIGELLLERGEVEQGEAVLDAALSAARGLEAPELVGRAAYALANHRMLSGRLEEAAEGVEMALECADQAMDAALSARTLKLRATLNWFQGRLVEAERDARASATAHLDLGAHRGAAEALGALGNAHYQAGRLDDAKAVFLDALEHAREASWLTGIGKIENGLALIDYHQDDWDGAAEHWRSAIQIAERTGNRFERVILLINVGLVAMNRGEEVIARGHYGRALALARAAGFTPLEARVLCNMGELHLKQGELLGARQELAASLDLCDEVGPLDVAIECKRVLLEVDLAAGKDAREVALDARELLAEAERAGLASELPHIYRVRGEALARQGRRELGEDALVRAWDRFKVLGSGYEAARVVRKASSLAAEGLIAPVGLPAHLEEARKTFRRLSAHPELVLAREAARGLVERENRHAARPTTPGGVDPITFDSHEDKRARSTEPFGGEQDAASGARALSEAARRMGGAQELDELLQRVVDEAMDLVSADRGFIVLWDQHHDPSIRVARGVGGEDLTPEEQQLSQTVMARVAETTSSFVIDDVRSSGEGGLGETIDRLGLASLACVPIERGERALGLLYVDTRRAPVIDLSQRLPMLEALAVQASVLIDNQNLFDGQQHKDELLEVMVHELDSPVDIISRYAEALIGEAGANARLIEFAEAIGEQAYRLQRMARNLADVCALSADELAWSMVSVQVKDLVGSAVDGMRPAAKLRSVALAISLPNGLPTLYGNRERLIQVMTSLIEFAVARSPSRGLVMVRASEISRESREGRELPPLPVGGVGARRSRRRRGDDALELSRERMVRIDVIDEAEPLSEPELERLFKPEGSASLNLARRIVEKHGARVWAQERAGRAVLSLLFPAVIHA